ncbi:DUF1840 domain-containing protein [Neptunomonas phycophila]|uniref:DUF1840 domain-containing protein n=1 Tax=Neptunomonas phycophila TaxID=1572645 RepID=A0ABT9EQP7_9GAMM|nr:DUF1840 domain-containing protein [Neptunomonas phycophila]MDP2521398.1 DUF1840 domain-containing protein [Neptunomonas phycophila]
MIVTFSTDAFGDMTMFGDVAVSLLKKMGHSGTVPGAIMADDVPAALAKLTTAIEALKEQQADPSSTSNKDESEPAVSLAKRALPLINLLKAAAEKKTDVMWE